MKRAFLTGVSGFVGAYLAKQLIDSGVDVSGLVRRNSSRDIPERLVHFGISPNVNLHEGDLTDLTSLLDALDRSRPDVIFHLAAQSYIPRSFANPLETFRTNILGTANLLEAVRLKHLECKFVFAGSSEEYGLQLASQAGYDSAVCKYGSIFPPPAHFPELPVSERNLLRPMSPYAASKVQGECLALNYHYAFGMDTVASRAFNHEGAGRGHHFVTASIVSQCIRFSQGESDKVVLGNVNAFRDWSHVLDIVDGYILLAQKGPSGEVYVQGSMRMHSVLTYLLMTLDKLDYRVESVSTWSGQKRCENPLREAPVSRFGLTWSGTRIDDAIFGGVLEYEAADRGLILHTSRGPVNVEFDPARFRPADVPVLLSDSRKIQGIGFKIRRSLRDIIRDQINYYFDSRHQSRELAEKSHA